MENWKESYNWTHDQFLYAITDFERDGKKQMLNLDCEHCSISNMRDVVKWALSRGHSAEMSQNLEYVRIRKTPRSMSANLSYNAIRVQAVEDFIKLLKDVYSDKCDSYTCKDIDSAFADFVNQNS